MQAISSTIGDHLSGGTHEMTTYCSPTHQQIHRNVNLNMARQQQKKKKNISMIKTEGMSWMVCRPLNLALSLTLK